MFTTGLWYHRLCRALRDQTVTGAMSKSLGNVDAHIASEVVRSVIELPPSIGLTSLRTLGWHMADLVASGSRLNLLSLEDLQRPSTWRRRSAWRLGTTTRHSARRPTTAGPRLRLVSG